MGPLYDVVLKALALAPGAQLLDIGCASGIFCQRAVNNGVTATGLDLCRTLVGYACQQVPSVRFYEGDMESLPFPNESFDVVTGLNVFYYASSPLRALREAYRVLRPGGRLVVSSWGNTDRCDAGGIIRKLNTLMPPSTRHLLAPFSLSANGTVKALTTKAGFTVRLRTEALINWDYPNEPTTLRAMLAVGPAQCAMHQAGEFCVREAIRSALTPFRLPRGGFRLCNYFNYLVAQKC